MWSANVKHLVDTNAKAGDRSHRTQEIDGYAIDHIDGSIDFGKLMRCTKTGELYFPVFRSKSSKQRFHWCMMSGVYILSSVVGSCMYIQLSVISVWMSTDTVSSSNYRNVRSVWKEQDWPKYTALRDTVVDFGVHGVLVSDSWLWLCTTCDETLDPRQPVVMESKEVAQSVKENVVVHCIKSRW